MREEYKQYIGDGAVHIKPMVGARITPELKATIELIAAAEDDSVANLIIEGLGRVLESRQADPEFREKLETSVEEMEGRLEAARNLLS